MTIQDALAEYKKNIMEVDELTQALFTENDKDKWITLLHKRAERLTEIYQRDNELLDFVKKNIDFATPKELDDAFEELYDFYKDGYDDAPLLIPVLTRVEEYFKEIGEYGKCIAAASMHAYEAHEYISRLDPTIPLDVNLYKHVLDQKVNYDKIDNPRHRWNIFSAYYNIIATSESISGVAPEEVYKYLLECEEFYKSEVVQRLSGDDELINETMGEIQRGFLSFNEKYGELSDFLKDEIYRRAKSYINEEDIYKSPYLPFMAYTRCLFERKEIDKEEMLNRIYTYFKPIMDNFFDEELTDERISQGLECVDSVLIYLNLKGEANVEYYYQKIKNFFLRIEATTNTKRMNPFLNSCLAEFVVKSLPFEKNKEEVEQTLFDNLVKGQAATYIHSVMVMKIAELIYEYMDKDLFKGVNNPLEYIRNSALLHDIGKSKITDIINMQRRKLSDSEFNGIRYHPSYGSEIILKSDLLKEYYDVIIGHHKWYNGLGGYPKDFDNTKSKYRIVIDLITISDCLDAATDRFGRNYKNPKSVVDVLKEFEEGKGVKYNPYLVDLIKNNPNLIERLEDLTQYKRPEYMYRAYTKEYISEQ